ncbi:MAG: mechanosensitive ion channel [Ignavibacteria bacterium]|nr:mechanosensitive ion channel [Ignavibacteria bacterium]
MEFTDIFRRSLFKIGDTDITILSLIIFVIVIIITLLFAGLLRNLLLRKVFPKYNIAKGIARAYAKIINYLVLFIGIAIALSAAGLNLSIILAGSAGLFVGIGFGLQNIANNFISGVIILFEKQIKEGDFIRIDDMAGTVKAISARSTRIVTTSNTMIIIPNSKLIENYLINESFEKVIQLGITLNINYDTDFERIKPILLRLAGYDERILKEPEPIVVISNYTDNGQTITVWVSTDKQRFAGAIRSRFYTALAEEFKKEGLNLGDILQQELSFKR